MLKDISWLCGTLVLYGFGGVYLAARGAEGLVVAILAWIVGSAIVGWLFHSRHHKQAIEDIEVATDLALYRAKQEEAARNKNKDRNSRVA